MRRFRLTATLFLLSGGTALLYQVAFGKKLATIFGATAYAVSAVLAAFMGGLALGSHLGGRWARRIERPLVAYGVAELVVAAVCALTPWLFDGVAAGYLGMVRGDASLALVTAARMLLTVLVVAAPTVAMGATLPFLSRSVAAEADSAAGREASRRRLAVLYAINTGGGALGAVLSAYLVLPSLGLYATMRAAALVNAAIGITAILVGRRERLTAASEADSSPSAAADAAEQPWHAGAYSALAFASGLLVFSAEVVDTHLLALLIGNSAYAFGLMLAAFLTCLSAGAMLAGWVERRFGHRALTLSLFIAAAALLLSLPIWGRLPMVFLATGYRVSSWAGREWVRAIAAFVALVLPTTAMGLTFPLLLRSAAGSAQVAQRVGRLTAVNTVGSIAGSVLCGYFILPLLGSQWTLRAVALCFAACAVFAAATLRPPHKATDGSTPKAPKQQPVTTASRTRLQRPRAPVLAAAAAMLAGALLIPRWDMRLMTNGANVYFDTQPPPDALVYVREDVHGGLTSVARRGDVLTMYTNGKFQGDNGAEVTAQRSFAHFPSMFVHEYGRALVIGLGTGTTLGTVAAYPYQEITVAEISPAIVEAARTYFQGPNRNSLADPRVKLDMNDGRNVLFVAGEPFDIITIELTSVWFAGAANLYSQEFYQLCESRLTDRGILQQWVQLHHIRERDLAVVLRTMRSVFPHIALFVSGGQGIIVAGKQPLVASRARLSELSRRSPIAATLGDLSGLRPLLDRLLLSGPELDRFIAATETPAAPPQLSTDENLYLEYETPKGNVMSYDKSLRAMIARLEEYRAAEPAKRHLAP